MVQIGNGPNYNPPAPPRHPPTVIRPAVSDEKTAVDNSVERDANANAVPNLPVKTGGSTVLATAPSGDTIAVSTLNRKVPPPRPVAPPKAPARAKKLARQQQDGSQSPTRLNETRENDSSAALKNSNVAMPELENDVTILKKPSASADERDATVDSRTSSIPSEPPPVPPHCDDYDPDTYEYMEPIDALHRPPGQNIDGAGVATNWKPVSSSVGGPNGEGGAVTTTGANGVPPKPRRSFKEDKSEAEEPTR